MLIRYIIFRLNLINLIIWVTCFNIAFFTTPKFCFAEKLLFNVIDKNIHKKHYFSLLKEQDCSFSIEILKKIFKHDHGLKYQVCIQTQCRLDNDKFLFLKYSGLKEYYRGSLFKNILLIGSGYNIFYGPVFLSQIQCSPSLYYVRHNNQNDCFRSLMYGSGMYACQLINNIYCYQSLNVLANFEHIRVKFENSLNIFMKSQTILLKCSYKCYFKRK